MRIEPHDVLDAHLDENTYKHTRFFYRFAGEACRYFMNGLQNDNNVQQFHSILNFLKKNIPDASPEVITYSEYFGVDKCTE